MNRYPDGQADAADALKARIAELRLAIEEEYRRLGRSVPQMVEHETKAVNDMTDELVLLGHRLQALEDAARDRPHEGRETP